MDCPRCPSVLEQDGATWRCPARHGRLLPAEAVRPSGQRRLAAADVSFPSISCPSCGESMHLYHPKGVDVDVCGCGSVWLDAGEEKALRERHPENAWVVAELIAYIGLGAGGLG